MAHPAPERNNPMEIERKFLISQVPEDLERHPRHRIEQGYLNVNPVVRVRRQDEEYFLTYKGSGMLAREEYNLPLTREGYEHLIQKADGHVIAKTRYLLPLNERLTVELDVFEEPFAPLILAEVEFSSVQEAEAFVPPAWFGEDVTYDPNYHNSNMSRAVL